MRVCSEGSQLAKLEFKDICWMICEFCRQIIVGAFLCIYQDTRESEQADVDLVDYYLEGRISPLE